VADEIPAVYADFAIGAQVAGYVLREQVGWGGIAAVYRAYDVRLDRWVALKILAPEIARDTVFRQRFISESRTAAAVDHPHIIPVFEAGEADGVLFIAMRYIGGGDVGTLVRRLAPLDAARAASIIAQVASALDAAHAAGLVHRDVKPANMLLAAAAADSATPDHVYLSDFGLSKQALSTAGPTLPGQCVGTLDYMAPEQIEAQPVDGRADLYALACTGYEMLAGRPPFRREDDLGLLWEQLGEPPPSLTSLRPDLPPAIDQVLARAMARSPGDRYQSCRDFTAALLDACGLESSASGQLLAGSPGAAVPLAAPLMVASPALPSASRSLPKGIARIADHAGLATMEVGLAGLELATDRLGGPGPGGPGPDEPGTYSPAPRGRSPVIAAAAFVVILAIAGATFLALRGGGASSSRHAAGALPTAPASQRKAGNPGRTGHPGSSGNRGLGRHTRPGNPRNPSMYLNRNNISLTKPSRAHPNGPVATVSAYIAAINRRHYARAWRLAAGTVLPPSRHSYKDSAPHPRTLWSSCRSAATS
jgi:hypothetical protein